MSMTKYTLNSCASIADGTRTPWIGNCTLQSIALWKSLWRPPQPKVQPLRTLWNGFHFNLSLLSPYSLPASSHLHTFPLCDVVYCYLEDRAELNSYLGGLDVLERTGPGNDLHVPCDENQYLWAVSICKRFLEVWLQTPFWESKQSNFSMQWAMFIWCFRGPDLWHLKYWSSSYTKPGSWTFF